MLPKTLKYGSKVESVQAKSFRSNIQPQSGTSTYGLGDTIIINIPTRSNLLLNTQDSYLKFNVSFKNGSSSTNNYARWDNGGCHACISRVKVFHGSNLLEDISEYGLLAKMLFDIQVSGDATYGKYNVMCGTRNDLTVKMPTLVTNATTISGTCIGATGVGGSIQTDLQNMSGMNLQALQTNSGDSVCGSAGMAQGATTTSQTYCINLISLVGTLCPNLYLPLYAMTSAPLRVEITLVDNVNKALASVSAMDTTWSAMQITNCEYVGNFIELSDTGIDMINSSLNGERLQMVFGDYRTYSYSGVTINAAATIAQTQFSIPAKFSSLKSIIVMQRDKGLGATGFFPHSSVVGGITDYTFRIGSGIYPAKAPNTNVEMFCEVMKAIGTMSDLNHCPSIEKVSYSQNVSNAYTAENPASGVSNVGSGSFYIGLDLESYAGSDKSQIFAGYNSNTDDIYLMANISITGSSAYNPLFNAFALFDSVLVFENNTAYVVF